MDGRIEISIVLLTFNGEKYLSELLTSINAQKSRFSYEILAIDSGSTDRTLEILGDYPVRVIEIPNREFGHGRTRNLGAKIATGRYIVFLTQDATPANENWLDNLVRPLVDDGRVVGSYSRQLSRPDCNPVEARDIAIGAGPLSVVKRVDFEDPLQKETYNACQLRFLTFSNVSSCIRSDVLEQLPFSETIVMVEDQEWCKRAIESGHWIVYEATSVVYHSHNHSLPMIYSRHFDYGMSLRQFADMHPSYKDIVFYVIFESIGDVVFILRQRKVNLCGCIWIVKAPIIRFVMRYGLYRGLCESKPAPVVSIKEVVTNQM